MKTTALKRLILGISRLRHYRFRRFDRLPDAHGGGKLIAHRDVTAPRRPVTSALPLPQRPEQADDTCSTASRLRPRPPHPAERCDAVSPGARPLPRSDISIGEKLRLFERRPTTRWRIITQYGNSGCPDARLLR